MLPNMLHFHCPDLCNLKLLGVGQVALGIGWAQAWVAVATVSLKGSGRIRKDLGADLD